MHVYIYIYIMRMCAYVHFLSEHINAFVYIHVISCYIIKCVCVCDTARVQSLTGFPGSQRFITIAPKACYEYSLCCRIFMACSISFQVKFTGPANFVEDPSTSWRIMGH